MDSNWEVVLEVFVYIGAMYLKSIHKFNLMSVKS